MNKNIILLIAAATATLGARGAAQPGEVPAYLDDTQSLETRVEDALQRMTLDEKIAMIHAQSKFSAPGCPRLGIPELWMSDGPHGVRMEISWDDWSHAGWTNDSCTAMPALSCLAATFNPSLAFDYGLTVGQEARVRHKDMMLGPGVNIYRTPLCGRNFEYMGEDPYLTSQMVVPYIRGMQSQGVSACVKHFALNNQERDRDNVDVTVDERALNEIYLPAFKAAVQEGGTWSLMGSYNRYKGQHCCHNDTLLNHILKDQWGFDGVVVTDWGGCHDTQQAATNGLDLEMGSWTNGLSWGRSNAYDQYYMADPLKKLITSGQVPQSKLDDKVRRVLRLHFRTNMDRQRPWGSLNSPEHLATARRIADEGIVLLKNDGNLLPLASRGRVAIVGENAVKSMCIGGGSSELKPRVEISPLEALRQRLGPDGVTYSMGYASGEADYNHELPSPYNADSLRRAAVEAARRADVVVYVGGLNKNYHQDCEGDDRRSYSLPFGQEELIADLSEANPNMVVVLLSGNAVAMDWADRVPAIVQGWYMGSMAGEALTDVLTGDVNPSGRLPFSIAYSLSDYPSMATPSSYPGVASAVRYDEGLRVGYRGMVDGAGCRARYPFGHGLSYTTFAYGPLTLDKENYEPTDTIHATIAVTNTGAVAGAETVQLYASQAHPQLPRPLRELKAFAKTAIEPGQTVNVALDIPAASLAYYDPQQQQWVLDPDATFSLQAGASSADIRSQAPLKVNHKNLAKL